MTAVGRFAALLVETPAQQTRGGFSVRYKVEHQHHPPSLHSKTRPLQNPEDYNACPPP